MRFTGFDVNADGKHIGSSPIKQQAVDSAKAYAFQNRTTVSVVAAIDDGRTREIKVNPDGSIDRLWEKSGTVIFPDCVYTNHNGSDYLCKSIPDDNSAIMERVKDGWTLVATVSKSTATEPLSGTILLAVIGRAESKTLRYRQDGQRG